MAKRLSDHQQDSRLAEYTELLQEQKHKNWNSLDEFFARLTNFSLAYGELCKVTKILLVLSYSQATAERGFSVNRQISVENLAKYLQKEDLTEAWQKIEPTQQSPSGRFPFVPKTIIYSWTAFIKDHQVASREEAD